MAKIKIKDLEPIDASKAKLIFGEVLHETSVNGKRFVVKRSGRPVSVILSYNEYLDLIKQAKEVKSDEE